MVGIYNMGEWARIDVILNPEPFWNSIPEIKWIPHFVRNDVDP